MSKLQENPEKVVPMRALSIASVLTVAIVLCSFVFNFNLMLTLLFFWLGTIANMIAFRLLIVGVNRMLKKEELGQKASIMPNLLLRYALYIVVLAPAWFIGGIIPSIAAFIGIQISQIAIRLDSFVG